MSLNTINKYNEYNNNKKYHTINNNTIKIQYLNTINAINTLYIHYMP